MQSVSKSDPFLSIHPLLPASDNKLVSSGRADLGRHADCNARLGKQADSGADLETPANSSASLVSRVFPLDQPVSASGTHIALAIRLNCATGST